jgi:hypothetical protein
MSKWTPTSINLWDELGDDVVGAIHADIDALHANLAKAAADASKRAGEGKTVPTLSPTEGQIRAIFQRHIDASIAVRTVDRGIDDAVKALVTTPGAVPSSTAGLSDKFAVANAAVVAATP